MATDFLESREGNVRYLGLVLLIFFIQGCGIEMSDDDAETDSSVQNDDSINNSTVNSSEYKIILQKVDESSSSSSLLSLKSLKGYSY